MTQTRPDISALDINSLHDLKAAAELLIAAKQQSGRDELLDRLARDACRLGFESIEALMDGKKNKPKKYRTKGNGAKPAKSHRDLTTEITESIDE